MVLVVSFFAMIISGAGALRARRRQAASRGQLALELRREPGLELGIQRHDRMVFVFNANSTSYRPFPHRG